MSASAGFLPLLCIVAGKHVQTCHWHTSLLRNQSCSVLSPTQNSELRVKRRAVYQLFQGGFDVLRIIGNQAVVCFPGRLQRLVEKLHVDTIKRVQAAAPSSSGGLVSSRGWLCAFFKRRPALQRAHLQDGWAALIVIFSCAGPITNCYNPQFSVIPNRINAATFVGHIHGAKPVWTGLSELGIC